MGLKRHKRLMQKNTDRPLFTGIAEREKWLEHNCYSCKKADRPNIRGGGRTQCLCAVKRDINLRDLDAHASIAYNSLRTTAKPRCEYFIKSKGSDEAYLQMNLFDNI